jgi:hypothetical protein
MGKMLDIPECDEADIYPRTLLNSLAAIMPATWRRPPAFYDVPGPTGAVKVH